jgi:hypothetical protein
MCNPLYGPSTNLNGFRPVDTRERTRTARPPLKSLPDTCGTTTLSELWRTKYIVIELTSYQSANQATEIFLLGVGNAFFGVSNMLIHRGTFRLDIRCNFANNRVENLYKRVSGVISFVSVNPVRAVASTTQTWLSKWYREVSQKLFVNEIFYIFY